MTTYNNLWCCGRDLSQAVTHTIHLDLLEALVHIAVAGPATGATKAAAVGLIPFRTLLFLNRTDAALPREGPTETHTHHNATKRKIDAQEEKTDLRNHKNMEYGNTHTHTHLLWV